MIHQHIYRVGRREYVAGNRCTIGVVWGCCGRSQENARTKETMRKRLGCGEPVKMVVPQELVEKVDAIRANVRLVVCCHEPVPGLLDIAAIIGRWSRLKSAQVLC